MSSSSEIAADLAALRSQLREREASLASLFRLHPWVAWRDIALDMLMVLGAVAMVVWGGPGWALLSLLVIGNRQRALGNVLHDAGHGNLCRDRSCNDTVAQLLVAPLLFSSLSRYRSTHFQHHARLGDTVADPDFLCHPLEPPKHWVVIYGRFVFSWRAWSSSLGGHLLDPVVSPISKAWIALWWAAWLGLLWWVAGADFTLAFAGLWLLSRATVFHLITTFREMCDHFGLQPAGVFTFTRDMHCHGLWRLIIHPRNNGYHLTHHLLPAVPYYHLPAAHQLLEQTALYRDHAHTCKAYFAGDGAVTRSWTEDCTVR